VIGKKLNDLIILRNNVYNINKTEVLLNVLNSFKVLMDKDDLDYRGAGVKRTLITAIECISVNGRSLHSLIIWPTATHRNT
jgi:hypothetical protein